MPLASQNIPLQFSGLDTKTDPRQAVVGSLLTAQNIILDAWPKIQKRNGYQQIAAASAGNLATTYKNELFVGSGSEAYSLATSESALIDKGVMESFSLSTMAAVRSGYAQVQCDVAVHPSGITVYASLGVETLGGNATARYSVYDTATGQQIVGNVFAATHVAYLKCLSLGNFVILTWIDGSTGYLNYAAIPVATPGVLGSVTQIATDVNSTPLYDATVIGTGLSARLFVQYVNSASSNRISVKYLSTSLVVSGESTFGGTDTVSSCMAIWGDGSNNVWSAWYTGSTVRTCVHDFYWTTTILAIQNVTTVAAVAQLTGVASGTTSTIVLLQSGTPTFLSSVVLNILGVPQGSTGSLIGLWLASKPFIWYGRVHVLTAFVASGSPQNSYFLVSLVGTVGIVVGKLAYGNGGWQSVATVGPILAEAPSPSSGVFRVPYLETDLLASNSGTTLTQAGVMGAVFDFTKAQVAQELSDDLHISGGIMWMYDGASVCEHGFHIYPDVLSVAVGAGGNAVGGTYSFFAVYEWMDAQGLIHQSSPSTVVTLTGVAASASFTYTVSTLKFTSKKTPISLVIYRTSNPVGGALGVFTRVTSPSLSTTYGNYIAAIQNSTTTATVTSVADTLSDATVYGNTEPPWNPQNSTAELPNLAADAPLGMWRYRQRIFYIPAESPYDLSFSKLLTGGQWRLPVEFNPQQLYLSVPEDGGPLVGGIEMDGNCIVFSTNRIYLLSGDGPAANGTGSDYGTAPQRITSDVGCTAPRSITLTPAGVMFQSAKGWHLLGRDLSVQYIGAAVEALNGVPATGGKLLPGPTGGRRCIFPLASGNTALVYDYLAGPKLGWSTWTNHNAADLTVFQGLVTYLQPGGAVMQETPGYYSDFGSPVLIGLVTTWLSFAGLSGFQRVWRFTVRGDYLSPHILGIGVGYDDSPVPLQMEQVDATSVLGIVQSDPNTGLVPYNGAYPSNAPYPAYEFTVKLARQKCSSVQLWIQEAQTGPVFGAGLALSGVTFLVGTQRGLHPVPASRSV
jgi:hypothetical protein